MKHITAEMFKKATGYDPVDDNLERCNCLEAGTFMHSCCGWNEEQNLPQFMVGTVFVDNLRKAGL